jgi:hypothetical protein
LAIDTVADAVTARQAMTLEVRSATVDVVIAVEALQRHVGGHDIMRKQLERLLEIADPRVYPWVTLKLLPRTVPPPIGDSGGLSLLRFKALSRLGAAYLEGPDGGRCLHGQDEIAACAKAFHETQQAALPLTESRHLLEEMAAHAG